MEYFILAQTTSQTVGLDPINGESAPFSYQVGPQTGGNGVFINEFLAKNNTINMDEANEYEDWIELYNGNASAVDVSGAYLTDDLSDLMKWPIPTGTIIDPGDTLLVWADDEPGDGPMHATFKLGASGEEIALVDTDGSTVLDYFIFGSGGRHFHGPFFRRRRTVGYIPRPDA